MHATRSLAGLLAAVLLAACSGGQDGSAQDPATATPASATPATSPSAGSAPATPAPAAPSAPTSPSAPPSPPPATAPDGDCLVNEGPVLEAERDLLDGVRGPLQGDVDGDGQPDEVYLKPSGGDDLPRLIVRTATSVISDMDIDTRLPDVNVQGLADADGDGRDEIFLVRRVVGENGVGSSYVASLAVFVDCALTFVTNADGLPYDFTFGGGLIQGELEPEGTGVGCADADEDGTIDLVGLAYTRAGDQVNWTSTIVEIEGSSATNGFTDQGTFTLGADDEAIARLSAISCGDDDFADPLVAVEP